MKEFKLKINKIDDKSYNISYFPWYRTVRFTNIIEENDTIFKVKLPNRPTRIVNAFVERAICPKGDRLLLIGYGDEDYISPYNDKVKGITLMDVGDPKKEEQREIDYSKHYPNSYIYVNGPPQFIQEEACNVNKLNKTWDSILIGYASIDLSPEEYMLKTVNNCLDVSESVTFSIRGFQYSQIEKYTSHIAYKTKIGTFNLCYGQDLIIMPDAFIEEAIACGKTNNWYDEITFNKLLKERIAKSAYYTLDKLQDKINGKLEVLALEHGIDSEKNRFYSRTILRAYKKT